MENNTSSQENCQSYPDFLSSIMENPPSDVSSACFVFKSHKNV